MASREIKGFLFCIHYHCASSVMIECESKDDLFRFIAQEQLNGYLVSGASEVTNAARRPKVKVFTDKRYKNIYKEMEKNQNVES